MAPKLPSNDAWDRDGSGPRGGCGAPREAVKERRAVSPRDAPESPPAESDTCARPARGEGHEAPTCGEGGGLGPALVYIRRGLRALRAGVGGEGGGE